jgi:hypothetical protein
MVIKESGAHLSCRWSYSDVLAAVPAEGGWVAGIHTRDRKSLEHSGPLIHIEVALENPLLHGVGDLGLLRHLTDRRLHDGNALGPLVTVRAHRRRRTGHGTPLGSSTEVVREVVAFACKW